MRVRAAARQGREDMRGPHVSLCWWQQAAGKAGLAGPETRAGPRRSSGLNGGAGLEKEKERGGKRKKVFKFQNPLKQMNSNQDLNPNTQKQCTSMNATVNSYISLIN
jgi:hypothetical protein